MAISHQEIGSVRLQFENARAALVHLQHARDLFDELDRTGPDPDTTRHLAITHQKIGDAEKVLNGAAASLPHFETAYRMITGQARIHLGAVRERAECQGRA